MNAQESNHIETLLFRFMSTQDALADLAGALGGKQPDSLFPDEKVKTAAHTLVTLETGMERDEDGVVLGSTRLPSSQRLHRKGDATREAGSLVGPMTVADSPSAISVFRITDEALPTVRKRPRLRRKFQGIPITLY
jgi:hypothetical protein